MYELQKELKPKADVFARKLREFGNGEYFNEGDGDNPDWQRDYWGMKNYARLFGIKRRVDPDNFFTCHHCVGSYTYTYGTSYAMPVSKACFITLFLALIVNIILFRN